MHLGRRWLGSLTIVHGLYGAGCDNQQCKAKSKA